MSVHTGGSATEYHISTTRHAAFDSPLAGYVNAGQARAARRSSREILLKRIRGCAPPLLLYFVWAVVPANGTRDHTIAKKKTKFVLIEKTVSHSHP